MLHVKDLKYTRNAKRLIDNLSLEFAPGKIYGILGPNGSGKTTFLKVLSGIWTATGGSINWNHENLLTKGRKDRSRIISLVPQTPHVPFNYLVGEIVAMGSYPLGRQLTNAEIDSALKAVDAHQFRDREITALSSGERQRVFIARSLVAKSPVLLLDEPTTFLDLRHQYEIWNLLDQLREQGRTIIVTNHDLAMTKKICDEVIVLDRGQCMANGSFEEVITPKILTDVFGLNIFQN